MSEELIKRARELTQGPPSDWTWEAAVERQTERLSLMRQLADALEAAHTERKKLEKQVVDLTAQLNGRW